MRKVNPNPAKSDGRGRPRESSSDSFRSALPIQPKPRHSHLQIIRPDFVALHYPCYWHYDILAGLKAMVEADRIRDERCREALDLLETKQLPSGGFPAEKKHYRLGQGPGSGASLVDWGGTSTKKPNEFVSADAFQVLRAAGRLRLLSR